MSKPSKRAPKVSRADRDRQTAEIIEERSTSVTGKVILLPSLIEVARAMETTNAVVIQRRSFPVIIEEQTGLEVVHKGLVAIDPEGPSRIEVEAVAKQLPPEELAQLVANLTIHWNLRANINTPAIQS